MINNVRYSLYWTILKERLWTQLLFFMATQLRRTLVHLNKNDQIQVMKRLIHALRWFWVALTKPKVFRLHWFRLVEDMMQFLEKTASEHHPMKAELEVPKYNITKLGEINWIKDEYTTVLHLWCGVDNIDSPFKRISELKEENDKLKMKINLMLSSDPNPERSVATTAD